MIPVCNVIERQFHTQESRVVQTTSQVMLMLFKLYQSVDQTLLLKGTTSASPGVIWRGIISEPIQELLDQIYILTRSLGNNYAFDV